MSNPILLSYTFMFTPILLILPHLQLRHTIQFCLSSLPYLLPSYTSPSKSSLPIFSSLSFTFISIFSFHILFTWSNFTCLLLPIFYLLNLNLHPLRSLSCCLPSPSSTHRDEVNLTRLQEGGGLKLTLVDHHVLPPGDAHLLPSVVAILDHRPLDPNAPTLRKDECCLLLRGGRAVCVLFV